MNWRLLSAWGTDERPTRLWPWLGHTGSLTEKLRGAVGAAFHVEVLRECTAPLTVEDALLLHQLPGTAANMREVYLCGTRPCVYARTLVAADAQHWLRNLNAQPLGDRVFAAPGTERLPIQGARLASGCELYAAAVKRLAHPPAALWARRSVLVAGSVRILIYECFLGLDFP